MLSWMIALPTMVRGRGQPRASGMNVSPEITAAMERWAMNIKEYYIIVPLKIIS